MIELKANGLEFRFPDVLSDAVCRIEFQRTLRIPDDNRAYRLPPGLGAFAMAHVEDHAQRVPATWLAHGGTMLPMYQAEALWISFRSNGTNNGVDYPFAVKIAAGKINALTGEPWANALSDTPQDYIVVPEQPWLDGFSVQKGLVRQFVAMPMGEGYTAEEQLTGVADHGGLQVIVYPMRRERYLALVAAHIRDQALDLQLDGPAFCCAAAPSMGLAPGGLMEQEIYDDPYGLDAWDLTQASRCFVHILNSEQWHQATGKPMPEKPVTASDYTNEGLPWFDYYAEGKTALEGSASLAGLDSVAAKTIKLGNPPLSDNEPVQPGHVIKLGQAGASVSDGSW